MQHATENSLRSSSVTMGVGHFPVDVFPGHSPFLNQRRRTSPDGEHIADRDLIHSNLVNQGTLQAYSYVHPRSVIVITETRAKPTSKVTTLYSMASRINFYSELAISLIRISDIANSE